MVGAGPDAEHRFFASLELWAEDAIYDALILRFAVASILEAENVKYDALILRFAVMGVLEARGAIDGADGTGGSSVGDCEGGSARTQHDLAGHLPVLDGGQRLHG